MTDILKKISDEKGSVSIIVALGIVALLGFGALVIDVGLFYITDNHLSNSVDAAALAGARDLPLGGGQAETVAMEYALRNGLKVEEVTISIEDGGSSIVVSARRDAPLFFGRLLINDNELNLERSARATSGNIGSMFGAAPLGVKNMEFQFGDLYTLKVAAGDDYETELGVGNYGALALGETGANIYENNLTYGYPYQVSVGDIIITQTGNISNPTKRAIDKRIDWAFSSSYTDVPKGCSRVLYIPVFEPYEVSPNMVKSIEIVGFAAFWVEEVVGQGDENQIRGYFLRMATEGEIVEGAPDLGLQTVKLTN